MKKVPKQEIYLLRTLVESVEKMVNLNIVQYVKLRIVFYDFPDEE